MKEVNDWNERLAHINQTLKEATQSLRDGFTKLRNNRDNAKALGDKSFWMNQEAGRLNNQAHLLESSSKSWLGDGNIRQQKDFSDVLRDDQIAKLSENFNQGLFNPNEARPLNATLENSPNQLFDNPEAYRNSLYDKLEHLANQKDLPKSTFNESLIDIQNKLSQATGKEISLIPNRDSVLKAIASQDESMAKELVKSLGDRQYVLPKDIEGLQKIADAKTASIGQKYASQIEALKAQQPKGLGYLDIARGSSPEAKKFIDLEEQIEGLKYQQGIEQLWKHQKIKDMQGVAQEMKLLGHDMPLKGNLFQQAGRVAAKPFQSAGNLAKKAYKAGQSGYQGMLDEVARKQQAGEELGVYDKLLQSRANDQINSNYDTLEQNMRNRLSKRYGNRYDAKMDAVFKNARQDSIAEWLKNPKAYEEGFAKSPMPVEDEVLMGLSEAMPDAQNDLRIKRPVLDKIGAGSITGKELGWHNASQIQDVLSDVASKMNDKSLNNVLARAQSYPELFASRIQALYPENQKLVDFFNNKDYADTYFNGLRERAKVLPEHDQLLWDYAEVEAPESPEYAKLTQENLNKLPKDKLYKYNSVMAREPHSIDELLSETDTFKTAKDTISDAEFKSANASIPDSAFASAKESLSDLEYKTAIDSTGGLEMNSMTAVSNAPKPRQPMQSMAGESSQLMKGLGEVGAKGARVAGKAADGLMVADALKLAGNARRDWYTQAYNPNIGPIQGTINTAKNTGSSALHWFAELGDAMNDLDPRNFNNTYSRGMFNSMANDSGINAQWQKPQGYVDGLKNSGIYDPYATETKFKSDGLVDDASNYVKDIANGWGYEPMTGTVPFNENAQNTQNKQSPQNDLDYFGQQPLNAKPLKKPPYLEPEYDEGYGSDL